MHHPFELGSVVGGVPDDDALPVMGGPFQGRDVPWPIEREGMERDDGRDDADLDMQIMPVWGIATAVTVRGRIFYNDRRDRGRHDWRDDISGNTAEYCDRSGQRADGSSCSVNWVGLWHAMVDVYEIDDGYEASDPFCERKERIARAFVHHDGSFSVTFDAADMCATDTHTQPAIALRVRLRYCNSSTYCFSLNEAADDEYGLWLHNATVGDPRLVSSGGVEDLGNHGYYLNGTDPSVAEDHSIAANYYATLVDTVRTLHRQESIPFYYEDYGEVEYIYPSTATSSGTTKSASRVVIAARTDWIKGPLIAHEYGHVVHLRAWEDDAYGWDGIGASWSIDEWQTARLAFKEGWANFISRVVHATDQSCTHSFDSNSDQPLDGAVGHGDHWVRNVTKMLCDWNDAVRDNDASLSGPGDHFTATVRSTWYNLRRMWTHSSSYGGDRAAGLDVCDYLDYYVNVRKSASAIGATNHRNYERTVADLTYQNQIHCDLPDPSGWSDESGWY